MLICMYTSIYLKDSTINSTYFLHKTQFTWYVIDGNDLSMQLSIPLSLYIFISIHLSIYL